MASRLAIVSLLGLVLANPALAAGPDLALAERLVAEKRYQEADELLAPFAGTHAQTLRLPTSQAARRWG